MGETVDFIAPPRREGPCWTTERGELPVPALTCSGCRYLRVQDRHYFSCRDISEPIWSWPEPRRDCRFVPGSRGESTTRNSRIVRQEGLQPLGADLAQGEHHG